MEEQKWIPEEQQEFSPMRSSTPWMIALGVICILMSGFFLSNAMDLTITDTTRIDDYCFMCFVCIALTVSLIGGILYLVSAFKLMSINIDKQNNGYRLHKKAIILEVIAFIMIAIAFFWFANMSIIC